MKITYEMVEYWIGSDTTRKEVFELITDIANGDYEPKGLVEDILSCWECEHKNTEWIPAEDDIGVSEDVICEDCGESIIDQIERGE